MIVPRPERRPRSSEESVLPLINIVFLLLIFFMLAGVLTQNPPFTLVAPSTVHARQTTQLHNQVLSVGADGQLAFAGKSISRGQLARALADWPNDKALQVRADGRLKAKHLDALLAILRRSGIREINLLTRHVNQ